MNSVCDDIPPTPASSLRNTGEQWVGLPPQQQQRNNGGGGGGVPFTADNVASSAVTLTSASAMTLVSGNAPAGGQWRRMSEITPPSTSTLSVTSRADNLREAIYRRQSDSAAPSNTFSDKLAT